MRFHIRAASALALSGLVLFGAMCVSTTLAEAQQKKGKTTQGKTKPAAGASAADIAAGKKLYEGNGCIACHMIGDKGGKTGTNLTHIGKTKKADWIAEVIRDPKKANKESSMPAYGEDKISAKELKQLSGYLASLK